ncbi:MAG: DUF4872 domain-containing protein, partial [Armatimonadetes bacterium]|nr:DUF4872 domain-containing protein [Anaerolineae bacterium]
MPILNDYHEFAGRHWETGTMRNALAYQGVKAPHTGEAVSEALLLGVSGGITFGYFTFEYEGYLPHIALLTRNTFNPMQTVLERLAIPQEILRTPNPQKGEVNLVEVLESGRPALVWADLFSLPYNDLPYDARNWAMMPILVYGYTEATATIADRANCPLTVPSATLQQARGRVKKDDYQVMVLDTPDWKRLPAAVSQGIWQCISLYTEAPPKGKRDNFGLAALRHWATMLTNTRNKNSWARYFEPAERLWMALVGDVVQPGAYTWLKHGHGNTAERGMYADFLDEAATILNKPALKPAAQMFRESEIAWGVLTELLLPADIPPLYKAKTLLDRKQALFMAQGAEALPDIQAINQQLRALQIAAATDFALTEAQVTAFRAGLSAQIMHIHDLEAAAVKWL